MGATVVTGKRAAALRKADGSVIYCLFERTYEKNCYPHTDSWGAIAIGTYADVMLRVFRHAAACEGGSLQSRAGNIKPENYIAAWRRELASPVEMRDVTVTLKVGKSLSATIPDEQLQLVADTLQEIGRDDIFSKITDGVTVSLFSEIDLILALFGVSKDSNSRRLAPWRILRIDDTYTLPTPDRGPAKADGQIHVPPVKAYALGEHHRLVQIGNGPWTNLGWAYSAVGHYITSVAYMMEMQRTGSATRAIADFRAACENCEALPALTRLTVKREPAGGERWNRSSACELAVKLGLAQDEQSVPDAFTCDLGAVCDADALRNLTYLDSSQVEWHVPQELTVNPSAAIAIPQVSMAGWSQEHLF